MELYRQTSKGPVLNKIIEISAVNRSGAEFPIELTHPYRCGTMVRFPSPPSSGIFRCGKKPKKDIKKTGSTLLHQPGEPDDRSHHQPETLFKEALPHRGGTG